MKIGLALSGGGARGIAHLGVLQALEEMDIRPHIISGTSAGAIVGAFYASGLKPLEIIEVFSNTKLLQFMRPAIGKGGLLNIEKSRNFYTKHLPHQTFEGLSIPLHVAATDIEKGEAIYFSEGALIEPLLASSCIPVVFSRMEWHEIILVDGGILYILPAEVIRDECNYLIGVHTNPYGDEQVIDSMKTIIEKSLMLALTTNARVSMQSCDLVIEPLELSRFSTFDMKKAKEIFDIGYAHTRRLAHELSHLSQIPSS